MIRTPLAAATGAVSPPANAGGALLVVGKRPLAEGVVEFTFARPDGSRLPDWALAVAADAAMETDMTAAMARRADTFDLRNFIMCSFN